MWVPFPVTNDWLLSQFNVNCHWYALKNTNPATPQLTHSGPRRLYHKIVLWSKWWNKLKNKKNISSESTSSQPDEWLSCFIQHWYTTELEYCNTNNDLVTIIIPWLIRKSLLPRHILLLHMMCKFIQWLRKKLCHSCHPPYILLLGGVC